MARPKPKNPALKRVVFVTDEMWGWVSAEAKANGTHPSVVVRAALANFQGVGERFRSTAIEPEKRK